MLDVPEQPPFLYLPLPHVAQVEHAVLDVPEQPPLLYLPVPHEAQVKHPYPLLVPLQEPPRYLPPGQFALEHVLHE